MNYSFGMYMSRAFQMTQSIPDDSGTQENHSFSVYVLDWQEKQLI